LLGLGNILPYEGRSAEAAHVLERAVALCEERGDLAHLGSALNNLRNVWVARGSVENAVRDQLRFIRIGRELGMVGQQLFGEFNVGELLYQNGDLAGAWPHVARAVELERRHPEVMARPVCRVLEARLYAFEERDREARVLFETIDREQREARAAGRTEACLVPGEQVLLAMVDLVSRRATDVEWEPLLLRSQADSTEQEPIEIAEMRGLCAFRRGDPALAARCLEGALELAARIPNVMAERIRARLESLRRPPRSTDGP